MKAARQLAALRRRHSKECAVCGKGFKAIATARYCSNACRQRAKYQRSKNSGARQGK
jgi:predicted nucleic acid-binding Zn ribbon protein